MAVMDEQVPGGPPAPGTLPGTPTLSPQALALAAMLAKQYGQPNPTAGMSAPQSTAAVTPLAVQGGAGGGGANMPPGVPGVPANNMPTPAGPSTSRPLPKPNQLSGGSYSFPNTQARNAAVVSTGIENMSEAIHNFKVEKDQNEYQQAKGTWDLYQKAAAIDPQTGQPVDPHTMHVLGSDGKIVKSWEKILKMQFLHEPGPPDPKTGKPTQGPAILPQPQADPAAQIKALTDQRALAQLRQAPSSETGSLTPAESHKAELIKAGITPSEKDVKASEKIDAEIAESKAKKLQAEAEVKRLDAETVRLGPNDPLRQAQIKAEKALALERIAQADKDAKEGTKAKNLQEFTVGRASIKSALDESSKELTKIQANAMKERGKIGTALGLKPDVTPEQDAKQNEVSARHDAFVDYNNYQDDVSAGRMTAGDAMMKARRNNNLDAEFHMWGGMPDDAPPPKGLPDGAKWVSPDTGETIGVVAGGKWVAP